MSAQVRIRPVESSDIEYVANNLRSADAVEVNALTDKSYFSVLEHSVNSSLNSYTADYEGRILAVFGMSGIALGQVGCVWMLGSNSLDDHATAFVRHSLKYLRGMQKKRSLFNYVHVDNEKTIKWLKWLGFSLEKPKPFGIRGEKFILFRGKKCA